MSMMDQFQKLDELIIELTTPPVRDKLRNQLSLTREQIEAYQRDSDKQDGTLQNQANAITKLEAEIKRLRALSAMPYRVSDDFEFNEKSGYWIERKTGLKVCPRCLYPPKLLVAPLAEGVGLGYDGNETLVLVCGQCGANYFP